MMSDQKVKVLGMMIDFIKRNQKWVQVFCIWVILGIGTLGIVILKTRGPWFSEQKKDVDTRYAIKMLNFHMPDDYQDMALAIRDGQEVPRHYGEYYQLAAQYMPQDFASQYMAGFYQHSQRHWVEAIAFYRKAIELNPQFFWTYYNAGIVFWNLGQTREAISLWSAGLEVQPQVTLRALMAAKLLTDCISDPAFAGHDSVKILREAYNNMGQWVKGQKQPANNHPILF